MLQHAQAKDSVECCVRERSLVNARLKHMMTAPQVSRSNIVVGGLHRLAQVERVDFRTGIESDFRKPTGSATGLDYLFTFEPVRPLGRTVKTNLADLFLSLSYLRSGESLPDRRAP
jgi:hypothetical protein